MSLFFFFFGFQLAECHSFVPSPSNTAHPSTTAPLYLIILPVAFHLPGHFKKQCIVNSLPEMRSNTYGASPATLFITINVSSSLHPSHTFITLVEMSNVFATVITPWWPWGSGGCTITKITFFFLLLTAICCTAESLNQCNLNIHVIFLDEN